MVMHAGQIDAHMQKWEDNANNTVWLRRKLPEEECKENANLKQIEH